VHKRQTFYTAKNNTIIHYITSQFTKNVSSEWDNFRRANDIQTYDEKSALGNKRSATTDQANSASYPLWDGK